ncbi:acetylglutamate kinase [Oecophyllibacter saccharovorans]|uniref:Acetylglutamate kinase n=1 Tax=Oecophyllibacter saccharovorans TaxID=2558360 RepID=A0A506UPX8_9PROT|nr:acetylglutamate kinase [Oecophyllibacter saccharovorans]QDH15675.1 acetylglutamate kinase [Oecophyllibacter saccharovorans]TPW35451.1 acetylglutamate kinase [Oecophyllibacter saccharovorans]
MPSKPDLLSEESLLAGTVQDRQKAAILADALPYLRRYAGDTIVVKYGGHAMREGALAETFGRDISLLKLVGINPIVVHGGGPQINDMLAKLSIETRFVDGLRVTDRSMIEVIEMVLAGTVNKQVADLISRAGALAVGISGRDGQLIQARKLRHCRRGGGGEEAGEEVDLGFVGEPESVDPRVLYALLGTGLVPVVAPVGGSAGGEVYNINADTAAGAIAGAVQASRLLMLTDVAGVLDQDGNPIEELTAEQARRLISEGHITGGMIPKVETCIKAVENGAKAAVILDGRVAHACLLELFTRAGPGTLIKAD